MCEGEFILYNTETCFACARERSRTRVKYRAAISSWHCSREWRGEAEQTAWCQAYRSLSFGLSSIVVRLPSRFFLFLIFAPLPSPLLFNLFLFARSSLLSSLSLSLSLSFFNVRTRVRLPLSLLFSSLVYFLLSAWRLAMLGGQARTAKPRAFA